jgi:hypothetical protein
MTDARRLSRTAVAFTVLAIFLLAIPFRADAAGKDDAPGRAASECAKISDPTKKDDCVRAARESAKSEKGKKDKDEKRSGKDRDKPEKARKDKGDKKEKGEKKEKKDKQEKQKGKS